MKGAGDSGASVVAESGLSEEQEFAQQYFFKILRETKKSVPVVEALRIPKWLVLLACISTYFNSTVISVSLAASGGIYITADALSDGVACGLLGALVLRAVERWRRECQSECPEPFDEAKWSKTCNVKSDELLEKGILLGIAPISVPAWGLMRDFSYGERSLSIAEEGCSPLQKAVLQICGSVASCCLVQGVVQQALTVKFAQIATWLSIYAIPEDPLSTWWWPAIASGPVFAAPVAATLAAAAFEFIVYLFTCELLLPKANSELRACEEAISTERGRSVKMFQLMGVTREVAEQRAQAFDVLAVRWQEQQLECKWRREVTNLVRVTAAAMAYTASGWSILAPVLVNVVVTDSVVGLFTGQTLSKTREFNNTGWD